MIEQNENKLLEASSRSERIRLALQRAAKRKGRPADPEEEADREADRFIEDFREALKRL